MLAVVHTWPFRRGRARGAGVSRIYQPPADRVTALQAPAEIAKAKRLGLGARGMSRGLLVTTQVCQKR